MLFTFSNMHHYIALKDYSMHILVYECSIKISQSTRNNKLRLFLLTHERNQECSNQCMLKKFRQRMQQDRTIVIPACIHTPNMHCMDQLLDMHGALSQEDNPGLFCHIKNAK